MIIRWGIPPTVKLCVGSLLEGVSFATHMVGGGLWKKTFFKKFGWHLKNCISLGVGGLVMIVHASG